MKTQAKKERFENTIFSLMEADVYFMKYVQEHVRPDEWTEMQELKLNWLRRKFKKTDNR